MNPPRPKRRYVWAKTGGLCWYCGVQLYRRKEANTELKERLLFTADHVHPRVHGGRGRANKVPACKYCNSRKSWRSVEQYREWVRTHLSEKRGGSNPFGKQVLRRWRIQRGHVVFYFEVARLG
jgi:5-methylcytosine-specific restriction endonuclease McrA